MTPPFIAAAAERANAAARLVPKDPEQQPMVRSSLRDGPGDPSCLGSHQMELPRFPSSSGWRTFPLLGGFLRLVGGVVDVHMRVHAVPTSRITRTTGSLGLLP